MSELLSPTNREYQFTPDGNAITSPLLSQFSWLTHCCTTRRFSPPEAQRFQEIRDVQSLFNLPPYPICYAQQKHTANVGTVTADILDHANSEGRFIFKETDAIACSIPDVTVALFTADCTPVFLLDPTTRAFALVHAGWKGTQSRITEAAIAALINLGSKPENIISWIGPAAGICCYEVSEEMISDFHASFSDCDCDHCFNGRMLDVVGLNRLQLLRAGVPAANISLSGICTIHEKAHFYSYRADNKTNGRILSMMTITDGARD